MINIIIKDIQILISDWRSVLLTFLLPVILITLFVFAFGGAGKEQGNPVIDLLAYNNDKTFEAENILSRINDLEQLHVIRTGLAEGKELVIKGEQIAILHIKKGFEDSLKAGKKLPLNLIFDQSKPYELGIIKGLIIPQFIEQAIPFKVRAKLGENIPKYMEGINPMIVSSVTQSIENDFMSNQDSMLEGLAPEESSIRTVESRSWGLIQAVAGTAVIMLLFSLVTRGASLLTEKESNTLARIMTVPLKPYHIIYAKFTYGFLLGMVQMIIMFVFASLVFGLDLQTNIAAILLMMIATAFACSSFGLFISVFFTTYQQAEIISIIIILVMSTLGGSMIPIYIMPDFMQQLAVISINYWSIQGFYDIFWRDLGITAVLEKALVLFGIGIILIAIARFFILGSLKRLLQ